MRSDHVDLGKLWVGIGKVIAGVAAAAFFAVDRGQGRRFGEGQQRVQIQGQMPARIVMTIAFDFRSLDRCFSF